MIMYQFTCGPTFTPCVMLIPAVAASKIATSGILLLSRNPSGRDLPGIQRTAILFSRPGKLPTDWLLVYF